MNPTSTAFDDVPLPARFWCGASYQWRNGGGHLTVAAGALSFEFDRLTKTIGAIPTITHVGDTVTVVHPRLLPIWTGLIVCGETAATSVGAWSIDQYPRLRKALIAAGFTIKDMKTWISSGEQMARGLTRERKQYLGK